MNNQKVYWEKKIIDWEKSVYKGKNSNRQPFFEKIATPFRKLNKIRTDTAERLVSPHIKNKVVADLGCGTGVFLEKLLKYKPRQLVGVDIASSAIRIANDNFKKRVRSKKMRFICEDLRQRPKVLKNIDVVLGIGFIDYFNPTEMFNLFKNVKGKKFLFSFPDRILSPREILQRVYVTMAGCPGCYKYSKTEMDAILKKSGIKDWWYYDKENIRFVTHLPRS